MFRINSLTANVTWQRGTTRVELGDIPVECGERADFLDAVMALEAAGIVPPEEAQAAFAATSERGHPDHEHRRVQAEQPGGSEEQPWTPGQQKPGRIGGSAEQPPEPEVREEAATPARRERRQAPEISEVRRGTSEEGKAS